MTDSLRVPATARRSCATAAFLAILIFLSAPASAQHRARLSQDLADRIASATNESTSVIVSGSESAVQTLAVRYGARLKKTVRGGGVLEVTGGQLAALSADPDVDHLSGDVRVQRMMAVTTEATGARQVWAGVAGLGGLTGRGIGVAVIDSGVAPHSALRGRVVASVDFAGPS